MGNCTINCSNRSKQTCENTLDAAVPIKECPIQRLISRLESADAANKYEIRTSVYDEIKEKVNFYVEKWESYTKPNGTLNSEPKRLGRMIFQAQTEEIIKNFDSLKPIKPKVFQMSSNKQREFKSTCIYKLIGNIFSKREVRDSKEKAIVIPGSQKPLEVYKSATDCLETNLTRVSSFVKAVEPGFKFELNKSYFYEKVRIVREEHGDGKAEYLQEGSPTTVNILFCVTSSQEYKNISVANEQEMPNDLEIILQNIFQTAKEMKIQELFIPPIGCGTQRKDPKEVSDVYKQAFTLYDGWVEKVIVYDKQEEKLQCFMDIVGLQRSMSSGRVTTEDDPSIDGSQYDLELLETIPIYDSVDLKSKGN